MVCRGLVAPGTERRPASENRKKIETIVFSFFARWPNVKNDKLPKLSKIYSGIFFEIFFLDAGHGWESKSVIRFEIALKLDRLEFFELSVISRFLGGSLQRGVNPRGVKIFFLT